MPRGQLSAATMNELRTTIPIIFHPGTYGTYLEYLLNTWTNVGENANIDLEPFTESGSSHNYLGNHVNDFRGWQQYACQGPYQKFVRLHPKALATDSVTNVISKILADVDTAIYIEATDDDQLWVLNNMATKIWDNWLGYELLGTLDIIYQNWPVKPGTPINDIPRWILREFLSFYLFALWKDMTELSYRDITQPGLIIIKLRNLIEFPTRVLSSLAKHIGTDLVVDQEFIQNLHSEMMSKQVFYNRDIYCKNIARAIINQDLIVNWQGLTIIDEAYIQNQLRLSNLELACNGLDLFPSTVKDILPFIVDSNIKSAIIEP